MSQWIVDNSEGNMELVYALKMETVDFLLLLMEEYRDNIFSKYEALLYKQLHVKNTKEIEIEIEKCNNIGLRLNKIIYDMRYYKQEDEE